MIAWNDHLPTTGPGWLEPPEQEFVGLDFLGTLQVNLDMIGDLTEGFNNVVSSARQHALLAWAAWRFRENLREAGITEADPAQWRAFLEAVETIQLVGHMELRAELGRDRDGLGGDAYVRLPKGPSLSLCFADYGRTQQTSAMAAVNYGPSAKETGVGLLAGWGGAFVPTEDRGLPLAMALDPLLRRSAGYALLTRHPPPRSMPRDLALDLARNGLAVGPLQVDRPERAAYVQALFDFDRPDRAGVHNRRRRTLGLFIEAITSLEDEGCVASDMEVRRLLLSRNIPGGEPVTFSEPLADVADRWRLFLVRQLQRSLLETWLYVGEGWMDTDRSPGAIAARVAATLRNGTNPSLAALAPLWELPTAEARTRFVEYFVGNGVGIWAASYTSASPWYLVWDQIRAKIRAAQGRAEAGVPGQVALTLAVMTLIAAFVPDDGDLGIYAAKGGRERISLSFFKRWCDRRARRPLSATIEDLVGELVLQQHVAVAAARFDNEKRRLRFCHDESGWELLPGTKPSLTDLTPDRLAALLALLADLGLLASRDGGYTATDEGRAILEAVKARHAAG
jgi:hypothetical protein